MNIRPYQKEDSLALTDIFYGSIHKIGLLFYSQEQINEWTPLPVNYSLWMSRFDTLPPYVAEIKGQIVSFISLTHEGHIEWIYTHKDYQKQGIAGHLYSYLEAKAKARKLNLLTVKASYFAKSFFKKHGFSILCKNNNERNGQMLINWSMQKVLD